MGDVAVNIEIPLIPPSGNHYKIPTSRLRNDGRRIFKLTPETKAWFDAIAIFAQGKTIGGDRHRVEFCVYLGKGQRGDIDNFCKTLLDGLVARGFCRQTIRWSRCTSTKSAIPIGRALRS